MNLQMTIRNYGKSQSALTATRLVKEFLLKHFFKTDSQLSSVDGSLGSNGASRNEASE